MNLPRTVWLTGALLLTVAPFAATGRSYAEVSQAVDSTVSGPKQPPNRTPVKPGSKEEPSGGTITVTHLRREVTSCHRVQEEGNSFCDAAGYSERTGEATVQLSPLADGDPERIIQVVFPNTLGRQSRQVQVPRGRWELQWKDGATLRERFFVVPRDVFEISLESTQGLCEEAGTGCKLAPGKRQRRIEIPKVRAVVD